MTKQLSQLGTAAWKITNEVEQNLVNESEYISACALQVINYPNLRLQLSFLLGFHIANCAFI